MDHNFKTKIGSAKSVFKNNSCSPSNMIVGSSATHHMWNTPAAFVTFIPLKKSYVTLASNVKIKCGGSGTIRIKIDTKYLQIHDVLLVPNLRCCLYSIRQHQRYLNCAFEANNSTCNLSFPSFSFGINDSTDMVLPLQNIGTTNNSIHWDSTDTPTPAAYQVASPYQTYSPPLPLPFHKPNPSNATKTRITSHQLHRYLGFRSISNIKALQTCIDNNTKLVDSGEIPKQIGDFTTIQRTTSNKSSLPRPRQFFDVAHLDIGYGDSIAPGGIRYVLLLVDRKNQFPIERPLQSMASSHIIRQLKYIKATYGRLPTTIYTDFDNKLLSKDVVTYCNSHNSKLLACPHSQQSQNGLCERQWQTLQRMARSYLSDMRMPRSFWYWAIRHSNRVSNMIPVKLNDKLTTPHELVYNTKLDYRMLFRLFSTTYFSRHKDGTTQRTMAQAHSMQGIAVGYSEVANGMEIWNHFYVRALVKYVVLLIHNNMLQR